MRTLTAVPRRAPVARAVSIFVAAALLAPLAASATTIVEYPVSEPPTGITLGPDGNLWFTEGGGSIIGRITPAGHVDEFPQSQNNAGAGSDAFAGIVVGNNGNLWFTDPAQNLIGRISSAGAAVQFPVGGTNRGGIGAITRGADGNYWFTDAINVSIGRITPSGAVTRFPVSAQPVGIVAAPDGNLWFTESKLSDCGVDSCATAQSWIGVMTTAGVVKAEYPVYGTNNPLAGQITLGPNSTLWFTQVILTGPQFATGGGRLGFVTLDGHVDSLVLPTPNAGPAGITTGPDGAIWFTERAANQIGRRKPDGNFNEYALPNAGAAPNAIVTGPDGSLWFTETGAKKIGRLTPGDPPPFTIGGYISGNWFDPLQPGQGFDIQVTADQQMTAIWFTYTPDGTGQNWIYAQGPYDASKNLVTLPAQLLTGAKFPPAFRPEDVHPLGNAPWGTLTFQFDDCDNGFVRWQSNVPGYDRSNGTPLVLKRLTQVAGTACPGR